MAETYTNPDPRLHVDMLKQQLITFSIVYTRIKEDFLRRLRQLNIRMVGLDVELPQELRDIDLRACDLQQELKELHKLIITKERDESTRIRL